MATYQYGILTTAEASGYNAATDDITFGNVPGATALNFSIVPLFTLRNDVTGGTVMLGDGADREVLTFPDGTKLYFPSRESDTITGTSLNDHIYGGLNNDVVNGGAGDDRIDGGGGYDTLAGGVGADTLAGGGDIDTFVFSPGDSGVTSGRIDVITDWNSGDWLSFTKQMIGGGYAELTASSYSAALAAANQKIADGSADVVAVQVGPDVFVFADSQSDNGVADDAIQLQNVTLNDISQQNLKDFAPVVTPSQGPGIPIHGTTNDDLLTGDGHDDLIDGGILGHDTLIGAGGNDTLISGQDGDSLSGGAGDDRFELSAGQDTISMGLGVDTLVLPVNSRAPAHFDHPMIVLDWSSEDRMQFVGTGGGLYAERTAPAYYDAFGAANGLIKSGYTVVAVQVGPDVLVFGHNVGGEFQDAVQLSGRTLNDIAAVNVGATAEPPSDGAPTLPAAPAVGGSGQFAQVSGDMDHAHLSYVLNAVITDASDTSVTASAGDIHLSLSGSGFAVDASGHLAGGTASFVAFGYGAAEGAPFSFSYQTPPVPLVTLASWSLADDAQSFFNTVFAGADKIGGGSGADVLRGFAGNDLMVGGGGGDTLWGGTGNDVIYGVGLPNVHVPNPGANYLRGEEGDDYIVGGDAFDDINGNQGNDTESGGAGDDWVVGGKDNDLLFGDAGNDLVYGNLGADTCVGGDGNDIVRGGQDNDVLFGGAGDDFVSGDKGDDTETGGAGADIFHTFGDAGVDRVLDFHASEGDRVMLDPGTQYTVAQVGADTVISMTGGAQMTLVGVSLSSLPSGWIFGA